MRVAAVGSAVAVLAATAAAGCGNDGPSTVGLPQGVAVFLDQARQDQGSRRVQIQVRNGTGEPLEVEAAELRSSRLTAPARYAGPALVVAGAATDLTVRIGPSRCARPREGLGTRVRVTYRQGAGARRVSEVAVRDRYEGVTRLFAADCARRALRRAAVRRVAVAGAGSGAELEVELELGVGAAGDRVRVDRVAGTTLLAPVGSGRIGGVLAAGDPPLRPRLRFRPNRCDVHAVAEDRAGTILGLRVRPAGGDVATVLVRMTEAQRGVVFDWLAERCDFAGGVP